MKEAWKAIQVFLNDEFDAGLVEDGIPGAKTAAAVADGLGLPVQEPEPGAREVNAAGLDLIKHFEGCLEPEGEGFSAYRDPVGIPTIGWGTILYPDGRKVRMGDWVTAAEADGLLAWEVGQKAAGVADLVEVEVTDNEFAALVSFAYNLGLGALGRSTLLAKLNRGDHAGAAEEFGRWNRAGGKVLRGLTRRRKAERELFLKD